MNICTSVTIVSLIYSFTGIGQCYDTGLLRLASEYFLSYFRSAISLIGFLRIADDRNLPSNSAYMRKLNDLSQLREKKATGSMYQSLMARHFRRKVAFEKSRQNFSFDSGETNNPPLTTENNRQPSQYRSRSARPIQIPFAVQADSTVQEDFFNPPIRSQDKWTLVSPRSDTVRVLFGNPLDLLNFRKKSSLSPKILSPSLISLSNRGSVGGRRDLTNPSLLSPVFLSLNNRTDALLSLPELLKDQPDLYPVAKELINLLVSDLKKLRPSGRSLSPSGGRDRLTWIRFKREKLTRDYARSLKEFHDNVWLVNATLRNEWRRWYKENRQLNDQQLDSLMTFRSSKSFDDELDADENNCDPDHPNCPVIMKPFINDTERASNPLVLNPVIEVASINSQISSLLKRSFPEPLDTVPVHVRAVHFEPCSSFSRCFIVIVVA